MNGNIPHIPSVVLAWQEISWLSLTALIFLTWWAYFARRKADDFTLAERILGAFIATIVQIQTTTFLLGWAHQLSWWPLGILNAVFTLGLMIRTVFGNGGRDFWEEIGFTIATFWQLFRSPSALWAVSAMVLVIATYGIYLGQLLPPMSYDSWSYHLGWVAFAHQEKHLGPFDYSNLNINYFPKNTDILFLWTILGTGTDRWANITQAPFAFASAISCYLIARQVGASREHSAITGLLIFSVPTVAHMMWRAMVDLAALGGFLAALAFLCRRRLTTASLVLAGCIAGFIVGTKGTAMYFFIGLLLFLVYRLLPLGMDALRDNPKARLKSIAGAILIFGGLAFVFGSYFYLRNWITTGNPTGVYEVNIGSFVLFEGTHEIGSTHFHRGMLTEVLYEALQEGSEWPIVLDGFFDPQIPFFQGNRIGGWGAVWTALLFPAIPIAFLWSIIRRKWSVTAIILACLIPFFLFKYNHTWTRYHLPIIGAGTTAFAYLLAVLRRTKYCNMLLALVILFMLGTTFISVPHHWLKSEQIVDARNQPYLSNDRYVYFNSWNDERFARILQSVQNPGTTLAFEGCPISGKLVALWNPSYSNRAVWAPWESDGDDWMNLLRESGAQTVYIRPNTDALDWAMAHSLKFGSLYQGKSGGIFSLEFDDEPD